MVKFPQQHSVFVTAIIIATFFIALLFYFTSSSDDQKRNLTNSEFIHQPHLTSSAAEDSTDAERQHVSAISSSSSSLGRRPPLRIAVAALLTANSKRGEQIHRAIDSLAVLRRSMLELLPLKVQKQFSWVIMLTDTVDEKWETVLKTKLGWTTVRRYREPPVNPATDIRNPQIAKEIVTDGAIGVDELTKLRVFEWGDEFDLVLLLDADILFHHPFPELYESLSGKALRWTRGGWASERINGGFLVVEPKGEVGKAHFRNMMEIVKEGDFRSGSGWKGSGIGWTYGGRTVQGVLPYYFLHHLRRPSRQLHANNGSANSFDLGRTGGGDDLQIDRCKYNNMDQLPECKIVPMKQVTSNHFTGDCAKPWWCVPARTQRCGTWARRWKHVYATELRAQGVLLSTASRLESSLLGSCDFESLALYWYRKMK